MIYRATALAGLLTAGLALPGFAAAQNEAAADASTGDQSESKRLTITGQDERATRSDLSQYFTGTTYVNPLFSAEDDSRATSAEVFFAPGARTNWHRHPVGQQLVVTDGIGRVQIEGGPQQTITAGDVVWIPADANHWHGAAPEHSMTHIAVQERREGSNVSWGDPVSDSDYNQD